MGRGRWVGSGENPFIELNPVNKQRRDELLANGRKRLDALQQQMNERAARGRRRDKNA